LDLAEKAFFDPSMTSLLYFPEEHIYAVYAPLFFPIAVPVVISVIKEIKSAIRP
jgi:phosphatidylinositol glycan class S